MKTGIPSICLGPTLVRIFDNCEKHCVRHCCGLEAFDIDPIWMVPFFEKSNVGQLSLSQKATIEAELVGLESDVTRLTKAEGQNVLEIPYLGAKCKFEDIASVIVEIRNSINVLCEEDSFNRLVLGRFYDST